MLWLTSGCEAWGTASEETTQAALASWGSEAEEVEAVEAVAGVS